MMTKEKWHIQELMIGFGLATVGMYFRDVALIGLGVLYAILVVMAKDVDNFENS